MAQKNSIMKTRCPYCNYLATEHETLDEEENPVTGDISFCINCGEVSKYKNNELVKYSLESLDETTKKEVNDIRVAWLKTKAIESVK